jgi:hypothetical protein
VGRLRRDGRAGDGLGQIRTVAPVEVVEAERRA